MNSSIVIVSIDGLDGVGKTTFAHNLTTHLDKSKIIKDINVMYQHFPRYDTKTGKQILSLLKDGDLIDPKCIDELVIACANDRVNWWNETEEKFKENTFNVVIADRYRISNLIYNGWRYMNEDFKKVCERIIAIENTLGVHQESLSVLMTGAVSMRRARLFARENIEDQNKKGEMIEFLDKKFKEFISFNLVTNPFILLGSEIDPDFSSYPAKDHFDNANFVADVYGLYVDMITNYINECFGVDLFTYFGCYTIKSINYIHDKLFTYLRYMKEGVNKND